MNPIGWQDLAVDAHMYQWRCAVTYIEARRFGAQWWRIWTKEPYSTVALDHVVRLIRKAAK